MKGRTFCDPVPASTPKSSPSPSPKPRRRSDVATLADVAREAGVSVMAASVVLNGAKSATRTSAETRARVIAAAERLSYRANATARALVNGRANAIGIVACHWKEEANLYFMEVFGGIIEIATASQQTAAVFMLRSWDEAQRRVPEMCDGRIDGLILVAPYLGTDASAWMPRHIPSVSLHSECAIASVVNLEPDEEVGSFEAVSQMLAMGHRRILHVGGPAGLLGAERRLAGYRRAYAAAGLQPPEHHVVHSSLNADGGRDAMLGWLRRHPRAPKPEAVFCGNDAIALGCIQALADQGQTPDEADDHDREIQRHVTHEPAVEDPRRMWIDEHVMGQYQTAGDEQAYAPQERTQEHARAQRQHPHLTPPIR